MVDYTERSFAFLDVLGFSNLVVRSTDSKEARERLDKFIDVADRLFPQWVTLGGLAKSNFFSDTILVSIGTPEHYFVHLVREVGMLARYLLAHGFATRGGITVGPVFHEGRVVVGPALITAYELEKRAVYPRVILDDVAMEYWRTEFVEGTPPPYAGWIKQDRDGEYFIDLFTDWSGVRQMADFVAEDRIPAEPKEFSKLVAAHIAEGRTSDIPSVRAKWEWLHSQSRDESETIASAV
ncbi:hypothetical protein [Reyranella sp.]|uniref:hypothetical protein n=1 Tax=Reyranella sp. TaxID=1929291 RepID=UPI003BA955DD